VSKKVCILTTAHSPFDERIFHKEAKSLQGAGYEVVIVAPCEEEQVVSGIKISAVPPFSSRLGRIFRLKTIYQTAVQQNADIYHFHDPDLIPVGLLLRLRRGKQVIYDVHEYYGDSLLTRYWLPRPIRRISAMFFDKLEKWAASLFSAVIVVNTHMRDLFTKVNPRVEVLHNYPLESQFKFAKPTKAKQPLVLYLGGINRERGLEVILKAMPLVKERFPQMVCELVGPVDTEDLSDDFKDLTGWLQRGNVILRGKVPYEEVPVILEKSSIALVPLLPTLNYQKAIPVKLLEYMAAGLPVIGADFGYIEQIIRSSNCGTLFEAGNHQELAKRICELIETPEKALYLGQNGWESFHREYTWEMEQGKLLQLYNQLPSKQR
jgi:glycosyltransferase involved in cell wall biosynthesis